MFFSFKTLSYGRREGPIKIKVLLSEINFRYQMKAYY